MNQVEKEVLRILAFFGAKDIDGMQKMFKEAGYTFIDGSVENAVSCLLLKSMGFIREATGFRGKKLYVRNEK